MNEDESTKHSVSADAMRLRSQSGNEPGSDFEKPASTPAPSPALANPSPAPNNEQAVGAERIAGQSLGDAADNTAAWLGRREASLMQAIANLTHAALSIESELESVRRAQRALVDAGQRQSGVTTRQMLAAPLFSFYVWPNNHRSYAVMLAAYLKRRDLRIISPLAIGVLHGLNRGHIVIDHATELSEQQSCFLSQLRRT